MMTCKEYTEAASRKLDQPVTSWARFKSIYHLAICAACRRFTRQQTFIQKAVRDLPNHLQ